MTLKDDAISLHRILKGKIEIKSKVFTDGALDGKNDTLSLIYTPGVAYVAQEISGNNSLAYEYTSKWNNVAIICDGTRVLGLGNVGPEAALAVMEGKSVLFKVLGGINAIPLCIATQDLEEIIKLAKIVEPNFGAVNIEDIESPKVLKIVERLTRELSIPVFHDDQHGTAVIALAALINALKLVQKRLSDIRITIAGAGSAGYGICKILLTAGCRDILVTDRIGILHPSRKDIENNSYKLEIARRTNPNKVVGNLTDAIRDSDVVIGVSGVAGLFDKNMIRSMRHGPIVFALSNPDPEILPPDAYEAGAKIVATGRSDYSNQVNNALVFPSVMRALLDLKIKKLTEEMLVSVAQGIAGLVDQFHLFEKYIIPKINDPRILPTVNETLKLAIMNHLKS
ncbi:MAG: NADP-dependent malic enzyme, partial [Nitrososphaeraceae archaeon]